MNVSQSSSDYGIDVFAYKNKYTYAIQCKRYSKTVGIKAVQEAKSGCEYYQCDIPVVFTNNTFSSAAINLAKNTNVELWDRDTLYHYLKNQDLTKSLPLYYPLFTFITTAILSYYYLHQDYLLIPLLINMFLFISIIVKILKDKKRLLLFLKSLNIRFLIITILFNSIVYYCFYL
ncbi:MAG: restriction endonuclease [Thomasclavelia ramosa]